jgi:hypothetical protein
MAGGPSPAAGSGATVADAPAGGVRGALTPRESGVYIGRTVDAAEATAPRLERGAPGAAGRPRSS